MPEGNILDMKITENDEIYVSTELGMAKIMRYEMKFQEKAQHFEDQIKDRLEQLGYVINNNLKYPGDIYSYT